MPNYQNGQIYKIISNHLPDTCYIGSTTQSLATRLGGHRRDYKKYLNGTLKHMITSSKICCYPDAKTYLIEDYPCNNKKELERREGEIMKEYMKNDDLEDVVNRVIVGRTKKEYYIDNQEIIVEKKKQYEEDNKEKITERRKRYYINNKEKIAERDRQYRINNKDKILERIKIKVDCEYCKSYITKAHIRRHQQSKKCQACQ